eukprot:scaffold36436_cov176-Amphora_coffeaeformis.AAC.14
MAPCCLLDWLKTTSMLGAFGRANLPDLVPPYHRHITSVSYPGMDTVIPYWQCPSTQKAWYPVQ